MPGSPRSMCFVKDIHTECISKMQIPTHLHSNGESLNVGLGVGVGGDAKRGARARSDSAPMGYAHHGLSGPNISGYNSGNSLGPWPTHANRPRSGSGLVPGPPDADIAFRCRQGHRRLRPTLGVPPIQHGVVESESDRARVRSAVALG